MTRARVRTVLTDTPEPDSARDTESDVDFNKMTPQQKRDFCKHLEHWETDPWAIRELLNHEILTPLVIDPCCGTGVLGEACLEAGYAVESFDIHDWGYDKLTALCDWTAPNKFDGMVKDNTVLMNPPFSKAHIFVSRALQLGARKVVCFQRYAFREADTRRSFWEKYPPNRKYLCGSRATCWRHDVALTCDDKGNHYDPETGKKLAGTPTAHAWYVWERGHPAGTLDGIIYKNND